MLINCGNDCMRFVCIFFMLNDKLFLIDFVLVRSYGGKNYHHAQDFYILPCVQYLYTLGDNVLDCTGLESDLHIFMSSTSINFT